MAFTNDEVIDAFDDVLTQTVALCRDIDESNADLPTPCPGWSVRDQVAHMVGLERVLAGDPEPTAEVPPMAHVGSDIARYMESHVHVRRGLPLAAVVDELDGFRPRRRAQLRELAAQGDPDVDGPFGLRPFSVSLPIRVFDLWAHEQDIRVAVGLAPRTTGVAADITIGKIIKAWQDSLPTAITDLDATLAVEVTDDSDSSCEIVLGTGGAVATLRADRAEVARLGCGRGPADIGCIDGAEPVAEAVMAHLATTP